MLAERTSGGAYVSALSRIEDLPPEALARLLLEAVEDYAIYLLDPGGHVASWNAGAKQIKGYDAAEIVGKHVSVFYTREDRLAAEPDRELLAASSGRYEGEGWRVRKDGRRFWANVVVTPVFGDGGQLLGFAKVTRDVTERRNAEEERLGLTRAQEALRLRDEFVGEARRALDTTLITIRVHLSALRETTSRGHGDTPRAIEGKLTVLQWGLDRLTRSVEQVLVIATETEAKLANGLKRPR